MYVKLKFDTIRFELLLCHQFQTRQVLINKFYYFLGSLLKHLSVLTVIYWNNQFQVQLTEKILLLVIT